MNDTITVDYKMAALAPDGRRFRLSHDVVRRDGVLAARLVAEGAWLDLTRRKLVPPPPQLAGLLRALPRTPDFVELADRGPGTEQGARDEPRRE